MKVTYQPDHEVSSASAHAATGRTLETWFAEFDSMGGPAQRRKVLGDYLVKEKKVDPWWATTLIVEYEKARGAVEKDGLVKGYNICVTKSIAAPPAAVYDAFLQVASWLGPDASADVREGGAFDDGDGHHGTFKRLNPGKTIRFTWEGDGHQPCEDIEIRLAASGAKTSVVVNHNRLPDRTAADGMRAAWAEALDTIKAKVA